MGFFSKLANTINEMAEESDRKRREEDMREQELLNEYRSRGIYVLAIYVNSSLWNYFYYPSEEYREESVTNSWRPFFGKLGVSWRHQFIDPR